MKRGLTILFFMMLFIAGCSKEPQPEDRFQQYIKLWNKQDFEEMYGFLTADAKKSVTKQEFVDRYKKIYNDLQITDHKVSFDKPKDEKEAKGETASYEFAAKMNSVAGEISFTKKAKLKKEDRDGKANWYVDWNPSYIFPQLEKGDKIGLETIPPKRGEIYDRNGNGMAMNGMAYEVGVVPEQMGADKDKYVAQLASLLGMTPEQINKTLTASWVKPEYFVPLKKVGMQDRELIAKLIELPPVQTKKVEARIYPYRDAAAHLIGYVGKVTADELEKLKDKGYSQNDLIGKRGLEQVFEDQLRGKSGVKITIKKSDDSEEILAEKPVENGKAVNLTINGELQLTAFEELAKEAGSVAAINPVTGETLALASSPSFDPNAMTLGMTSAEWQALEQNKQQPLTTRFKMGYAPGSVIKPITAAIALKSKTITADKTFDIKGLQWQKDKSWGNYKVTRVHASNGPVNLEKALVFSDNIYFAQTALAMGKDAFENGMKEFGFEEEMTYPFPLEKPTLGEMSSEIALADSGYGQGQMQTNIVHLLSMYTPFINSGKMIQPTLIMEDPKSKVLKENVTLETASLLSGKLRKIVADKSGTAHAAEIPGYPLSGKTGTAELKKKQTEEGSENGWFVAYNASSPDLMIAMMIENVQKRGGSQIPVKKVKNIYTKMKP